jgi:hypothetical protein
MLSEAVRRALDGKNLTQTIYAEFFIPPIEAIEVRPNVIFQVCAEKNVLHLGSCDHLPLIDQRLESGTYLHRQLTYVSARCLGVDINEQAVAHVRSKGIHNVITADMTQPGIKEIEETDWDWVVMADVLEHIGNPVSFLEQIGRHYGAYIDGVLITVPNALSISSQAMIANSTEMVNYDHCFWFTPYTLCKVVHTAGLYVDDLIMCSYENPSESIRKNIELYKARPIALNTIAVKAHWPASTR